MHELCILICTMNNKAFIISFTDMGLRILIASCLVALVCGKSFGKRYFVAFLRISIFVTVLKGIRNMRILYGDFVSQRHSFCLKIFQSCFWKRRPILPVERNKKIALFMIKKLNVLPVDTFKMKTFAYTMLTSCPFAMTNYPKAN